MKINTTKGEIEIDLLEKTDGFVDNGHEYTTWTEYHLAGELVRRDVHVTLKESPHIGSGITGF